MLRRSTSSTGNTTMTVYAFGLEEHLYSGAGVNQGNTYYYTLGGHLVGEATESGTNMFLTDALGSVITTISATANSAAVQGNQVYGPYGTARYQAGSMGTAKGFTGQYNDSLTGLDYYHARYYDPVVGRFLSADTVQGNGQGMDPYAYVGGNPETKNDPTGHCVIGIGDCDWLKALLEWLGLEGEVAAGGAAATGGAVAGAQGTQQLPGNTTQAALTTAEGVAQGIGADMQGLPRPWTTAEQEELLKVLIPAEQAARDAAIQAYDTAVGTRVRISREDPSKATSAIGILNVFDKHGNLLFNGEAFRFGFYKAKPISHAEQLILDWAESQILILQIQGKLTPGTVINLLIFTSNPTGPCGPCQDAFNGWVQKLYAATGLGAGQALVSLDVWYILGGNHVHAYSGGIDLPQKSKGVGGPW